MEKVYISHSSKPRLILVFLGWGMDAAPFAGLSKNGYDILASGKKAFVFTARTYLKTVKFKENLENNNNKNNNNNNLKVQETLILAMTWP